jgi:hypothetical protein
VRTLIFPREKFVLSLKNVDQITATREHSGVWSRINAVGPDLELSRKQ